MNRTTARWFEPRTPSERDRILELDAFRGLAALIVCIHHYTHRYDVLLGHPGSWADWELWKYLHHFGVPLFFIISGFVIPMTFDRSLRRYAAADRDARRGGIWRPGIGRAAGEFVWARFARLYPAFIVASVLIFVAVRAADLPGRQRSIETLLAHLTFFPRQFGFRFVDGAFWTLETELFFYGLVTGVVIVGLRRWLVPILAALVALDLFAPNLAPVLDAEAHEASSLLHGYWHFFLPGVIFYQTRRASLALPASRRVPVFFRPLVPWGTFKPVHFLLLALCAWRLFDRRTEDDALFLIAGAAAVWLVTRYRVPILESRALVFLGTISYSLYLIHQNIGYVLIRSGYNLGLPGPLAVALALLAALLLATALTFLIERPVSTFLRSRFSQRAKPTAASTTPDAAT